MGEHGITVAHTSIHRWTVRFSPLLLDRFNRRKRCPRGAGLPGLNCRWAL